MRVDSKRVVRLRSQGTYVARAHCESTLRQTECVRWYIPVQYKWVGNTICSLAVKGKYILTYHLDHRDLDTVVALDVEGMLNQIPRAGNQSLCSSVLTKSTSGPANVQIISPAKICSLLNERASEE